MTNTCLWRPNLMAKLCPQILLLILCVLTSILNWHGKWIRKVCKCIDYRDLQSSCSGMQLIWISQKKKQLVT
ncbi:UNVERIFIED_CONTAM: hypothetical protein NCL1_62274 [Trichonephila clavipes]